MRSLISFLILMAPVYCADFTTYIGGNANAIATDAAGDTYVAGNGSVTKLDASGSIVFSAPGFTYANAIALDPSGNVWVGGQGGGLPLVNPLQSVPVIGNGVGFLVKMAPDGTVLYASYFGGTLGSSGINGVATDQGGNVYVTGWTEASDFPTTPGLPASPVTGGNAPVAGLFVAKLDPTGQKIVYSTVIAGPANCQYCFPIPTTMGIGIAVDGSGEAFVAGDTSTSDLPVTSGGIVAPGAFALKINADGNALGYFTYLGSGASVGNSGTPDTNAAAPIAADSSGNAYIAAYYSGIQGFVTKLDPDGSTAWVTSLSALNPSTLNAISLDSFDNAWLTGSVSTPSESFVSELSADGSTFPYSGQFPAGDAGQAIVVDQSGIVHFAGALGLVSTMASTQPSAPRALSIVNAASNQLLGTITAGEIISIYGSGLGPSTPVTAAPSGVVIPTGLGPSPPATSVPSAGGFPTSLGGVQVLVNGVAIPLLYVSASQINAEIPSPLTGVVNGFAVVEVTNNSGPLPDFRLMAVSSDFAVFTNPGGSMAVINQDGTLNKIANPAKPGSVVSIWATGFGPSGAPVDGAVAAAANNYCNSCQLVLSNWPTSVTETVQYAGTSPGLIDGLMQINFMIPAQFNFSGAWVYFTPPGATQPIQLGWVNISQ